MFGPVFNYQIAKLLDKCERINPGFKDLASLDEKNDYESNSLERS